MLVAIVVTGTEDWEQSSGAAMTTTLLCKHTYKPGLSQMS